MFDRFTDRSRQVLNVALRASFDWNHEYIGTEHVLLGLLDSEGVASDVLNEFGVDRKRVRHRVEERMTRGEEEVRYRQLPFTPRSKVVLELALVAASELGHNYIGTEHLLLGLILEEEGIAACALSDTGLDVEKIREQIVKQVGKGPRVPKPVESVAALKAEIKRLKARIAELERRLDDGRDRPD